MLEDSPRRSDLNFINQQGLPVPDPPSCGVMTSVLLFQPRIVGLTVVAATVVQSPLLFAILGLILWWSALLPRLNPFDAFHNATRGRRPGTPRLAPAPAPRRFAQGMAGSFALAIALALASGARTAAYMLEALLAGAVLALVVFHFCLGSFIFHLVRGRAGFAFRTLPWGRGSGEQGRG